MVSLIRTPCLIAIVIYATIAKAENLNEPEVASIQLNNIEQEDTTLQLKIDTEGEMMHIVFDNSDSSDSTITSFTILNGGVTPSKADSVEIEVSLNGHVEEADAEETSGDTFEEASEDDLQQLATVTTSTSAPKLPPRFMSMSPHKCALPLPEDKTWLSPISSALGFCHTNHFCYVCLAIVTWTWLVVKCMGGNKKVIPVNEMELVPQTAPQSDADPSPA
ncbi:Protein CBG27617 [Caenorhabditis briggsae]|uniref:Uncharacterized protein n=2 Tax=Caenorhabditis briggsae TaxID=6238 RepID=A0AAE8ZQ93_CAEBR|nr:Protein CBG27617 [Caenorhabditis briggsae]ULT81589.1 hypothetical protein L3Y34_011522 [Caenorhabditis briggsae]UMM40904.1 hypothetical protein L5515_017398 [Caenorhabditis briggsae]CAR99896.1 Protein CBG27617 [Caenorhabditis briggsae]